MSATGETIGAIQAYIGQLEHAKAAAHAAAHQAEQARGMAAALGAARNIVELSRVHELVRQADMLVSQAMQKAQEAIGQAQAIESG